MDQEVEVLACVRCGNTEAETGEAAAPEYCECCEEDLCEACWMQRHVGVLSGPM